MLRRNHTIQWWTNMTYQELLYREQQDIKLLSDMIDKGLPVDSYIHLVKYKLSQLTKELQELNKRY